MTVSLLQKPQCLSVAARRLAVSRTFATVSTAHPVSTAPSSQQNHRIVIVGGGAAGIAASQQLFKTGRFKPHDIAIVEPSALHHYQPGWTLVGGGLKSKQELCRRTTDLVDSEKIQLYSAAVKEFHPEQNRITISSGSSTGTAAPSKIGYEQLLVVPGITLKIDAIKGLRNALDDPTRAVSSIYSYDYCDKVWSNIQALKRGHAIFTHPAGMVKCAGAPQKIMWLALDHWRRSGLYDAQNPSSSPISIDFATGLPFMFGVAKYSKVLDELRRTRHVGGLFQHDLVEVTPDNVAVFKDVKSGQEVRKNFDFLHTTPKMGPHDFVKSSPLANKETGLVEVDQGTTQHVRFPNVWSIGDASSLPTSKTMAAVTSELTVMVENMLGVMDGKSPHATYSGYASCPLLTEYGKVLLCEFRYGNAPDETFNRVLGMDQGVPRTSFYWLKKEFFPWIYYTAMVKGAWKGPQGPIWSNLFK